MNIVNNRIMQSPTLMTLFSLSSKTMSFIFITPFLLHSYSANEIALYYLLGIFINMQSLADFGFYNTFVRVIALAFSGGCQTIEDFNRVEAQNRKIGEPNTELAGRVIGTMKTIYFILTIIVVLFLIMLTPFLLKNINLMEYDIDGWIAWVVVIVFSAINFMGRPYSNFLLAQNKVALVRRWEGIYNTIGIVTNIVAILCFHSIAILIFTNQIWILANLFTNRYLANHVTTYKLNEYKQYRFDKAVLNNVWPVAWKSGVSSLTTQGIVSASGILCNHFCIAETASGYLFAEKLYNAMRSVAQAPFYSKVPYLVYLRGQQRIDEWRKTSQRGMFYAYSLMVTGIIVLDLFGANLFKIIKSNITFPDHLLWLSLGWAYLLHRYGAMHTQLYMTINKVNSHISDLIAGIIMVLVWYLTIDRIGVYSFPLGMLCGYLLFYIWYAGYYSYKIINQRILSFEKKAFALPFITLLVYTVALCLLVE